MPSKFLIFLLLGLGVGLARPGAASTRPDAVSDSIQALRDWERALELEVHLVRSHPEAYYLIVDLSGGKVLLKSGGNLLRSCAVVGDHDGRQVQETARVCLEGRIDPGTPEPGNDGLRLRGRRFPLNFVGRLIEGPMETSRFYFKPALLLQPPGFPAPRGFVRVELAGADLKALGSALRPGDSAILIPARNPVPRTGGIR